MSKKWFMVVIAVIAILVVFASCSTDSLSYEELADRLHEFPTEGESSAEYEDVSSFQSSVGLKAVENGKYPHDVDSLNELRINEEFYNVYIEKYGLYDLLNHFNDYLTCGFNDYFTWDGKEEINENDYTDAYVSEVNKRDKEVHNALYSLPAYQSLDTIVFDGKEIQSQHGAAGYYGGQKDTSESGKVSGEFNDSKNNNEVYEESATQSVDNSYFGDWMVQHEHGSKYNAGKYGWNNGVFEDEAASWDSYSTFIIYYCGTEWASFSSESLDDIHIEFKKIEDQPDKRFYFAYDGSSHTERIYWVDEPSTANSQTSDGSTPESSLLSGVIKDAEVGSYITLGEYEQDNNTENGKEPIKWVVLSKDSNRMLLLSEYVLEIMPIHDAKEEYTWATCSLRSWLNDDFLKQSFSDDEQMIIQNAEISDENNPDYGTDPGSATQDKVFLLSISETKLYLESLRSEMRGEQSEKAQSYWASNSGSYTSTDWWLRTPGEGRKDSAIVDYRGSLATDGICGFTNDRGVRPAVWIDLNK